MNQLATQNQSQELEIPNEIAFLIQSSIAQSTLKRY